MSSKVKIELVREARLNKRFEEVEPWKNSVYITYDTISSWIGYADSYEEVIELISPSNFKDTLSRALSTEEYDIFMGIFGVDSKYHFYDETYNINCN